MNPAEAVRAAEDLQANALLPAHVGKFTIARHPWDEPFIRIAEASRRENIRLLTPRIGKLLLVACLLSLVRESRKASTSSGVMLAISRLPNWMAKRERTNSQVLTVFFF
jgi:hypothetical protein